MSSSFEKGWYMKAIHDINENNEVSWNDAVNWWGLTGYSIYRYIYRLPSEPIVDGTSITNESWLMLDTHDANLILTPNKGYWILIESEPEFSLPIFTQWGQEDENVAIEQPPEGTSDAEWQEAGNPGTPPSQDLKNYVETASKYIHSFLKGYNENYEDGTPTYASKDANLPITIEQGHLTQSAGAAWPRNDDGNGNISSARIVISNDYVGTDHMTYVNDWPEPMGVGIIIHEILHVLGIATTYDDFWAGIPDSNFPCGKVWLGGGHPASATLPYTTHYLPRQGNPEYTNAAGEIVAESGYKALQFPDEWSFENINGEGQWNTAWIDTIPSDTGRTDGSNSNPADNFRYYYIGNAGLREYKRLLTPKKADGSIDTDHKMYWHGGRLDENATNAEIETNIGEHTNHFDNLVGIPLEDNFGAGSQDYHFEKGVRKQMSFFDDSGNAQYETNADGQYIPSLIQAKNVIQPVSLNHALLGRHSAGQTPHGVEAYELLPTIIDARAKDLDIISDTVLSYTAAQEVPQNWREIHAPNPLCHPVIPNDIMTYRVQKYQYITSMILGVMEDRGYVIDYSNDHNSRYGYCNTGVALDYIVENDPGNGEYISDPISHNHDAIDDASGGWIDTNRDNLEM